MFSSTVIKRIKRGDMDIQTNQDSDVPLEVNNKPTEIDMPTSISEQQASYMTPQTSLNMPLADTSMQVPENKESVPVVKVWSVRGVEYAIMSFMLWAITIAISWVIVALINGTSGFAVLSGPLALLIVSLPFFAFFFLRLKKAELSNPALRFESSKRKFSQISQIVSFFVIFGSLLTVVGSLLSKVGGAETDLGKTLGSSLALAVIWGCLFMYYWVDEHKGLKG